MLTNRHIVPVVDDAQFGEGPRWREGALWFSDIGAGQVRRVFADGTQDVYVAGMAGPSGLGWTTSGELLVASLVDSVIYKVGADRMPIPLCGPEQHGTFGTNDMATRGGRSYITCAGKTHQAGDSMDAIAQPNGTIVLLDHASGDGRVVARGYQLPNGIIITPDGRQLIVAEFFASRLLRFDIEPDGSLTNQRVFAQLDANPDGICLDAEGHVWAATTSSYRVDRISPHGHLVESVSVPDWPPVACALGGDDGKTLYIVCNSIESPGDIFQGRAKSRVYSAQVDVPAAAEQ